MTIEPCTTGTHSTTDLPPPPVQTTQPQEPSSAARLASKIDSLPAAPPTRAPVTPAPSASPAPPPESEDDDPALSIPAGKACRRRGCGATYDTAGDRAGEKCVHHPGVPVFHEGSKGYSCCKRRVMEFDQFMKLEGCKEKTRHLFVGSGKTKGSGGTAGGEEVLETVR